jgi:hypothetical protein
MDLSDRAGVSRDAAVKFTGSVECRQSSGVRCITLVGRNQAGEQIHLSLLGVAAADLPARLQAAEVERAEGERYRISAEGRTWMLSGRGFVHSDASAAFYAALRPRPVPLVKRVLWRFALAAARTRVVQWWLARSSA